MSGEKIDWSFFSMNRLIAGADPADTSLLEPDAWHTFVDRLREAGEIAMRLAPDTPVDRASAVRGTLQTLEFGLRQTMGSTNPYRPAFSRPWQSQLFDWGAANPDAVYRTVTVRDDATYRISGTLGNAGFASFEFFDAAKQTGSLVVSDLRPDPSGAFEVSFGPDERPGNWLRVAPGTTTILWREFFGDWAAARPTDMRIECVDGPRERWNPLSADHTRRQLEALGSWTAHTLEFFGGNHLAFTEQFPNAFRDTPTRGDSDLPYIYEGHYLLRPDEALIVEIPDFASPYWGLQLTNALWNTTNYSDHQSSLNMSQAVADSDGRLRFVVAGRDPGVANWLDTCGISRGVMLLRITPEPSAAGPERTHRELAKTANDWMEHWNEERDAPKRAVQPRPVTRVVAFDEIASALPADTPRVTPAERVAVIDRRAEELRVMQAG